MWQSIKVLYEDECLIVFDKPAGLLVIPSPKKEKNTLIDIVNIHRSDAWQGKLHPCHRLDRETSGVILFAKGKKNQKLMMQEFHKQLVEKKYIAFILGRLHFPKGELRSPIRDFHHLRFNKYSKGKLAITRYRVLTVKKKFSVVEIIPLTGRTHQIRIQFSQIGHPLLGERLYALGRDFPMRFRRLALHASELSWVHPIYKRRIHVSSDLPLDMQDFLVKN